MKAIRVPWLRVAANNFLAEGGDNFPAFNQALDKVDTQVRDVDAVVDYLTKSDKAGTPAGNRAPQGRIGTVN